MKWLMIVSSLFLFGCGDGENYRDSLKEVTCYSQGVLIYTGQTNSAVQNTKNSFFFKNTEGEYIEVSGDCIIKPVSVK